MAYEYLQEQVEMLKVGLTPTSIEHAVATLLSQGEDPGGGVSGYRLARHLLGGSPDLTDVQVTWVYEKLKPTLRRVLEQVPSLYYFQGD